MKKYLYILTASLLITACEDVIDVEVTSEEPRLIIDALIRVDPNEEFTKVVVKVSQTSSFFESTTPVTLEQISLSNLDFPRDTIDPDTLNEESPGSGIYTKTFETSFLTAGELVLMIEYEGEIFVARTSYVRTNNFNSIEQGDGNLFGDEETEIVVNFKDIPEEDNFYLFDFDFAEYLVTEDTFYQGQDFGFSYFYDEKLDSGQELSISIMGVEESFYNYMDQLIEQSGDDFGPFATPAATVRGNFINGTEIDGEDVLDSVENPNNFALGYFAICETFTQTFIVE
ncbi:DUF4249 family protein [Ascidiimonas sp. W6]|uniref:DUF4249 family protein n=1 Tax=Ascidiimonas meishanensis TaxID=3128903 RepID=UPI0030EC01AF